MQDKFYEEIEKTGLMDREMAIGKEAHEHLLKLEGKGPKKRKILQVCLHCGERSEKLDFKYTHKCATPMVVEEIKWPMPTRPKKIIYFEVYLKTMGRPRTFRFMDYESAMLFRRLIWHNEMPLAKVMKDERIRWYE